MTSPAVLIRNARLAAGLSQRSLAERARTSQPAVARYELGRATPSWETLERLLAACGRRASVSIELIPDPDDVALAETLLDQTPAERLHSLRRFASLRRKAGSA
jgi:transcriptional regulator with XRE-family HTH domain